MEKPDEIDNPRTGEHIRFVETAADTEGRRLTLECTRPPSRLLEAAHRHPKQINRLTVEDGHLGLRLAHEKHMLGPGDSVEIAPGAVHQIWVMGDAPLRFFQDFEPALNSEAFFRTVFHLAESGEFRADGRPSAMIMAELGLYFWEEFQVAQPHPLAQRLVYSMIWPFSSALGYGARVRQFG